MPIPISDKPRMEPPPGWPIVPSLARTTSLSWPIRRSSGSPEFPRPCATPKSPRPRRSAGHGLTPRGLSRSRVDVDLRMRPRFPTKKVNGFNIRRHVGCCIILWEFTCCVRQANGRLSSISPRNISTCFASLGSLTCGFMTLDIPKNSAGDVE
jgi:hypothetical protein